MTQITPDEVQRLLDAVEATKHGEALSHYFATENLQRYAKQIAEEYLNLSKEHEALKAQVSRLLPIARRTVWAAFVWNDHNFENSDLFLLPQVDLANVGIFSIDDWNKFCDELQEQSLQAHDDAVRNATIDDCADVCEKMMIPHVHDLDAASFIQREISKLKSKRSE